MEEHKENIHTKALNVQKMSNAKEDEKVGDSLSRSALLTIRHKPK